MRKAEHFFRAGWLAAAAAGLVLGVGGCGAGDPAAGGKSGSSFLAKNSSKGGSKADRAGLADMVAAVSSAKVGPPVEMKFDLPARPEVGQVLDLQVAIIPRAPVPDSLSVSFQAREGLEIVGGSQIERVDKLIAGTPLRHVVKVLPKRDGIFTLTGIVSFTQANQDMTRTFSIPVIAGEGLPEQVAKGP